MSINFRPFRSDDLVIYRSWFEDAETARWVDMPNEIWVRHVTQDTNSRAWMARLDDRPVAVLQADWDDTAIARVCIVVAPTARSRGIGTEALSTWLLGKGRQFSAVEGHVEPRNTASLKLAERCGFAVINDVPDEDGFLHTRLKHRGNGQ